MSVDFEYTAVFVSVADSCMVTVNVSVSVFSFVYFFVSVTASVSVSAFASASVSVVVSVPQQSTRIAKLYARFGIPPRRRGESIR